MRFAVDAEAVEGAGTRTVDAAQRLAGVDLAGLADAVRAAMPGARSSIVAAENLRALPRFVGGVVAEVADQGSRVRLAASQYVAADAVARAGAAAGWSPDVGPTPPPVGGRVTG